MSIRTRWEPISSHDDDTFEAYCAVPDGGRGPAVIVFQEIFGINDNMRGLADRLAEAGFLALVPDMFWRLERRFERKDESGIGDAFDLVERFDFDLGVEDIRSVHAHVLNMDDCTGKVGVMGFCLGGGLAFAAATMSRVDGRGPDAAVPYYGSPVNGLLGYVDRLECPTMFHYGNHDPFIPEEAIAEVEQAVSAKAHVVFHRYDAGHAFSNWDAPSMYQADAAELAWSRTMEFLDRTLR